MNVQRVNKLIKCLEGPFEEAFNMGHWIKRTECGTSCCAYGLYYLKHPEENPPGVLMPTIFDNNFCLVFDSSLPFSTQLASHFEISIHQAAQIFVPARYGYCNPEDLRPINVVERIREELFQ